jgi:hypothetical protein
MTDLPRVILFQARVDMKTKAMVSKSIAMRIPSTDGQKPIRDLLQNAFAKWARAMAEEILTQDAKRVRGIARKQREMLRAQREEFMRSLSKFSPSQKRKVRQALEDLDHFLTSTAYKVYGRQLHVLVKQLEAIKWNTR